MLADRLRMLERNKVVNPRNPQGTMYTELQSLVPFPQVRTVADREAPTTIEYDDRIGAVEDLLALAGCVPAMTREGALFPRVLNRWLTEPDSEFQIDAVIDWPDRGASDEFYNYVWAHDPDMKYSAFASIDDDADPLSVGRAGVSSYELSTPVIVSGDGAQSAADTALARLRQEWSRRVTIQCGPQAVLLDVGDFGTFRDAGRLLEVVGEVSDVRMPLDPTAPVTVEVIVAEARDAI